MAACGNRLGGTLPETGRNADRPSAMASAVWPFVPVDRNDRRVLIRFAVMLFVFSIVIVPMFGFLAWQDVVVERTAIETEERRAVSVGRADIVSGLDGVFTDLAFLVGLFEETMMAPGSDAERLDRLALGFRLFASNKKRYDQVRYIDALGHERLRVNYADDTGARLVAAEDLQNKRERYYFRNTIDLPRGQVFVSPLDLNVEGGTIEQPYKPVIRLAQPVFGRDGERLGIVIINRLGRSLLDAFAARLDDGRRQGMVINRDGYWLRGPSRDVEWGFMFDAGAGFHDRHPDAWRRIVANDSGQFRAPIGLVTFDTIRPLLPDAAPLPGVSRASAPSDGAVVADSYVWKTVSVLPRPVLTRGETRIVGRWMLIAAPVWLTGLAAIYGLSALWSQRQQAAHALALSETRFRDFADSASDWLWEMGPDLRFSWFSDRLQAVTGVEPGSLIGRSRAEIGIPDDGGRWEAHLDDLEYHRPFKDFQYRHQRGSGETIYFRISGVPVFGADGAFSGYRGTGSDVTARAVAERRATRAKELLEDAVNSIREGFALYDADNRLALCNDQYREVFTASGVDIALGDTFEDVVRRYILAGAYPEAIGDEEAWIARRLQAHRSDRGTFERHTHDDRYILIQEYPTRDGGVVVLRSDVTDIRRAEHMARRQAELIRTIVETVPHFVFWKDRNSLYLGCNRAFAVVAGVDDPASIVGRSDYDLAWTREKADSYRRVDAEVMESGEPRLNFEEAQHQADGSEATLLVSKVPLRDSRGDVIGVLGVFADISDLKRNERLLRDSQKLQALGDLAGGISHELNNLLLPVMMLTEATMKALPDASAERENLVHVLGACDRAKSLVEQIVAFSRVEDARLEPQDLGDIVATAASRARHSIPDSVEVVEVPIANAVFVEADTDQLLIALKNVISNGSDSMAGGAGRLTVATRTSDVSEEAAAAVRGLVPGAYAVIAVSDTGQGMDADTARRVFDPFFTTKEVGRGTGLGMSVVEGIITKHGGAVDIVSAPGEGTTVHLYLPLCPADAGVRRVASTRPVPGRHGVQNATAM